MLPPAAIVHAASCDTTFLYRIGAVKFAPASQHGGKRDQYDSTGTAGVARADLVRRRLVVSARAVRADMRCLTNEMAENGVWDLTSKRSCSTPLSSA